MIYGSVVPESNTHGFLGKFLSFLLISDVQWAITPFISWLLLYIFCESRSHIFKHKNGIPRIRGCVRFKTGSSKYALTSLPIWNYTENIVSHSVWSLWNTVNQDWMDQLCIPHNAPWRLYIGVFTFNAGFRLTCRLPHCRFDDDISSTAQASLAAEGWPSGKQHQANRSITLPLCPPRQIADSWILFNPGAIAARWKAKAALPQRAATLKQQAMPSGIAAKRRAAS